MPIVRAVFEQGVEVRHAGDAWKVSSGPHTAKTSFVSLPEAVARLAPLRPLLLTDQRNYGGDLTLLLRCDGKDYFGTNVSDLLQCPLDGQSFYPFYHLAYLLGAVGYHCEKLAELYTSIAIRYWEMTQIPGFSSDSDVGTFGYQTEPYYEFEALIGAARRSIDSTRYLLWNRFGLAKGSTPRSLEALLKSRSHIPSELHDQLTASWQQVGVPLTQYRDCIHHYVPVDFGMASAVMRRHPSSAWTTMIRIPDNPAARSKARFTFALNLDALTYAWELADEVLRLALTVKQAILQRKADA